MLEVRTHSAMSRGGRDAVRWFENVAAVLGLRYRACASLPGFYHSSPTVAIDEQTLVSEALAALREAGIALSSHAGT